MRRRLGLTALVAALAIPAAALLALRHRPQAVRAATAIPDSTCLSCHRDRAAFERTAHRLTSRHPTRDAIGGRFEADSNELRTTNPYLRYRVDSAAHGYAQTAISGAPPDTSTRTERVAYVVGSGRKG